MCIEGLGRWDVRVYPSKIALASTTEQRRCDKGKRGSNPASDAFLANSIPVAIVPLKKITGEFQHSRESTSTLNTDEQSTNRSSSPLFPSPISDVEEKSLSGLGGYFWGYVLLISSVVFFVTTMYAIVISKLMHPTGHWLLDAVGEDFHYCYLVPLTIYPSCAAIYMSWASLKVFRHN
ncbi:unnamed protein product [Discosporangium mesarthrocarpum]